MSKSTKSVSSSTTPSFSVDKFSSVLAESINSHANEKINEFFIKLSINLKDNGVEIEKIYDCWNKAMTKVKLPQDFVFQLQHKVKTTEKKEEKKASEPEIKCDFVLGAKSKNANMPCGELCKVKEPYSDGNHYCTKHLKQVSSKHSCEFVIGSKAKEDKRDKPCGARIVKGAVAFEEPGEFCGKWLCKKHTNQVNKQLEKQKNRCVHIFGERSSKPNTRCTSTAVENGRCSHHKNSGKKQEQENANVVKSVIEGINEEEEKVTTKKTKTTKAKSVKPENKEKTAKDTTTKTKTKKTNKNQDEININFSLEPHREPEFITKPIEFEDGKRDVFIDKKSGMTCIEYEEMKYLIGIWNTSTNSYDEYTQEAADYAAYHGIDKVENQ